jgi:predicted alpha-1,2-mannosidase
MKNIGLFIIAIFLLTSPIFAQKPLLDLARYVDPMIGTGGTGHTFPGASVPFGMVQLSPDTRLRGWESCAGYYHADKQIYGFSHTHLSGTGIEDYGDILFAPTIGEPELFAREGDLSLNGYASTFSHEREKAEAGFYRVHLDEGNILAEMTATTRVGLHRYTFPANSEANVILDLTHRDKVLDSNLKIVGKNRIEGYRRSTSWAKDQIVYFAAEFSKPFTEYGVSIDDKKPENLTNTQNTNIKAYFRFDTKNDQKVLLKVAISPVSIEGARKNLQGELPDWSFEKVRQDARNEWNKELNKIQVSGGSPDQLTNFYTSLYHLFLVPNTFSDVDGKYLGLDKNVHTAKDFKPYTIFSLWDTFRGAHPLYTILQQKRTNDFVKTFLAHFEQGGRLPVWELAANETDTMIGYHSVSVIADAYAKNIRRFDAEKAFEAMKHSAELDHFGLVGYKRQGYITSEDEQESVSKTLEYAYNDFCIAQMAKKLSKTADFEKYSRRAAFYRNIYDKEMGFMRPKKNGNWIQPFAPSEVTFHFTEANSWQYSFFVPQDVSGLIDLYGGKANFTRKLDELFSTESKLTGREQPDITGLIGQYAHGNEPSHHIAYLYNYAGEPWKTQKIVRRIFDDFYKPAPDGLIGNEDCGQMSAWYILSALGFYQVNPSQPVYAFGTPIFKEAKINLENGKSFVIRAENVSKENIYIQSAALNGKEHKKSFFNHNDLTSGGVLAFRMGAKPNKTFGGKAGEMPVSSLEKSFPTVPTVEAERVFENKTSVKITAPEQSAKIFYTTNESEPNENSQLYKTPFSIDKTTIVKAISIDELGGKSYVVQSKLNKMPNDWDVKLFSTYNRQYTGGGAKGLIDGIRGTTNFASGEWQGYQPQDFVAIIDLKRETEIHKVGGGFLQSVRSWIWMPTRIEFEVSSDGTNFRSVADIKTDVAPEDLENKTRDYAQEITPTRARYVRVKATNLGKIPAWHAGAGFDAFIFVDEIFIE